MVADFRVFVYAFAGFDDLLEERHFEFLVIDEVTKHMADTVHA